ncbi:putative AbiEi antitoxin of type IV toxin-antitoxin system [Murinocardiopsis flavida]|uniref:Putative AbiEi antitoxin of type IV toxin-antitoxin system n=1 Tax=Murinocardiopsis flavida TaxID=645275 RepID=A0A2P8D538_9ACTN|nr:type IV toxin-antitoxin system AbiEi family antitoxin domain-containing protein [Murinocardiopsis flavida]PSK92312.1 putative AbiEi antitoxin of type IV toxin-antitoxin system [Murinocardiopsis flavida]
MAELSNANSLAASQHWVLSRAQALGCGLSPAQIASLVRSRRWRRLRPGVYLARGDPAPSLAARVVAVQLAYGPRSVAVGPTAARLWRIQGLLPGPGYDHLHLSVAGRGSSRGGDGLRLHGWTVPPGEITMRGGIRLTTPARTLRDTVLCTDRHSAVSAIDSALYQGLVAPADLPALAEANAGRPGAPRSRPWWALADPRAQSTFESRLRLICVDAGIAPETLQYPVRDSTGAPVGYVDLAWPGRGVAAEADGTGPHTLPDALFGDRRRQNGIAVAPERLVLLRFAWRDLGRPAEIAAMIRAALRQGAAPAPRTAP